ncbi:MAG: DNA polymerase III subunit gamma/tau [Planctomycetaceae bacterium]
MSAASYTVLARRYRPQTFDDVVGQAHVGQAIRNAIKAGRVAHAYLFTGARGVGKTSTARIFAKALNCPHVVDGVPCNECELCQGISTGSDVDVLEIDGASNRGIDDIRQLRANVNVKSMRSRYKVYIIDEVHMLTKEAFNALLKTLEEPPPNVKFIFCTTEPNKVPDTILSRCQRFDFGTIATGSIAARLTAIAESEGIQVDAEAVELVARRASGSMRDSQSLFDQLLAFGEEHITTDDVHKLLGTAPDERLIELFDALIQRDRAAALSQLSTALERGVQLGPFSDQLLEYLRDLLIVLAQAADVPLLSVGESQRERLTGQGNRWGLATVAAAMQILAETKSRMQRANYGRALLELALVRISLLEDLDHIGQLIQQVGSGQPGSGAAGGSVRPISSPNSSAPSRPSAGLREKLLGGGADSGAAPKTAPTAPRQITQTSPVAETTSHSPEAGESPVTPVRSESTSMAVASTGSMAASAAKNGPESDLETAETASAAVAVLEEPTATALTADSVDAFWSQMVRQVPDTLATHLKNAHKLATSGPNEVEILFPRSCLFSMNYCQREETQSVLHRLASKLTGNPVRFRFQVDASVATTASRPTSPPRRNDDNRLRPKAVEDDPFVQQAVQVFGGTVVDVRKVLVEERPDSTVDADDEPALVGESEDDD